MYGISVEEEIIEQMRTNKGEQLSVLSKTQPVMLVFLRHFGCTFCREALTELSIKSAQIEEKGTKIVFVHMSTNEIADRYFDRYNLKNADHISDPECKYYAAFGLVKGNFTQLFGLQTWFRGFSAGVLDGHGVGAQLGDGFQMPGVFVITNGAIRESYIHRMASDRPDYEELADCCKI